jgi:PAS domain S-box-containing protein
VLFFRPSLLQLLPVLFFLLAAIPAGAIGLLLTNKAWDREVNKVYEQHLLLARYVAEALLRYAEDVEAAFQLTAVNIAASQPVQELTSILHRLHFKHVCIVDGTGKVLHLISPNPELTIDRVPEHLIATMLTAGSTAEHRPRFSHILPDHHGEPTIFLWSPLSPDRYALGALKTEYFVHLQGAIRFGVRGHAAIVDQNGRVIAHPNPEWRIRMQDISQSDPVRRMMRGETGVSWFYSPALQVAMIAGFTSIPKTGWGVMIPQPVSELEDYVRQGKRAVWSVIVIALCGAGLLGWLVSRWLATPLQRVGHVAERFANGTYEARIHDLGLLPTSEVTALAAQFNAMADEVNQSWQARLESEQRCREFAEIAVDWFWETDLQQVFTYVSPSSHSGWDTEALLGHHRREHIFDDPTGQIVAHIQRYMDQHVPFANIEYQILDHDGQPLHLSVAGKPMHDASGQVIGYRGVAQDVTQRLRAEARLRQAQQAEQHRHVQKMEALGTLAGGIAHDFNNILAAILGYTELTLYDISPHSPAWQNLQEVLTAGKRAKDLVRQILTFSRRSEQERKPLRFHVVLKESLKLLRATLPTTIGIFQDIAEDTEPILADMTQMQQVIMNLCANAEYAMRKTGGLLEVRLHTVNVEPAFAVHHPRLVPGPHIRLIVRDTGHGIAPEIMGRIFEPFFTTKDVGQGTGMGLAMVHGIVTSHGGAITVQSTLGQGTTFQIYLPCIETAVDGETLAEEPLPYGNGSILFVDDENSLAQVGQRLLEQLGYDVVVKTSSLEALGVFRIDPYRFDLVITDQTMPHVTGAALADKFRSIRPDIPIILCTGFSHTIDAVLAETQGIDAFLMKPLMLRDLGRTIQKVLAQRTSGPTTPEC